MSSLSADVAIVGGGIVGLAHAWAAARQGLSVVVFERDPVAQGASIRNFGMIWPVGQPAGEMYGVALRSRELWLESGQKAGLWVEQCGSLHLAYEQDELAVIEELVAGAKGTDVSCSLLEANEVHRRYPAVKAEGLRGAMWSPMELCVDPRQAISRLPRWLEQAHGVTFRFGQAVIGVEMPRIHTAGGETWQADRVIVCGGADFRTLFPEVFHGSGIRLCKLQMMRTGAQASGWRIGTHLAAGLTLCHYASFQHCPSLGRLRQRLEAELPEYLRAGIHVMASQNHLGEVVIGDSHEYDDAITPFDSAEIDRLIVQYLRKMVSLPSWEIAVRWHGVYARHPDRPVVFCQPQPGVTVFTAVGGAGMTLSFGLADAWWEGITHSQSSPGLACLS